MDSEAPWDNLNRIEDLVECSRNIRGVELEGFEVEFNMRLMLTSSQYIKQELSWKFWIFHAQRVHR